MPAAPLPLEILLAVMREKWEAGKRDAAAELARIAAPYLHGRRIAVRDISATDLQHLSDAELDRLIRASEDDGDAE